MDETKQTIYCPLCKRKVMTWDGKTKTPISCACRKCNRLVTFNPIDGKRKTSAIPQRTTASGMRIW